MEDDGMRKELKILFIIFIVALAVRLVFVDDLFTGDAIDTVGPARNFVEAGRAAVYSTQLNVTGLGYYIDDGLYFNFTHPPMRVALYALWTVMFGFSALPMLPILFGLMSLVFIYLIGKELYSEKVGMIAAAMAAVLRYHVYASVIGFGDNFLVLAVAASLYFFLMYARTSKLLYAIPSAAFLAAAFLTKFSILSVLPVFFVVVFLFSKNRPKAYVVAALMIALSMVAVFLSFPLVEYLTGVSSSVVNFFETYVKVLLAASHGSQPFLQEKAFYVLSYAWQLTPFFAVLLVFALAKLKRDKSFYFLASWLVLSFIVGFASSGQDFQRFMVIASVPAFLLVAKLVEGLFESSGIPLKPAAAIMALSACAAFAAAMLLGLSDMSAYYSPLTVAAFFAASVLIAFHPKRNAILLGAAVGISVFFLVGTSFIVSANSSAVSQIVDEVQNRGYPYNELWTTRDISLYLAPEGQPSFLQRPMLDIDFIKENVTYFAYYSMYEEDKILAVSELCEDNPFFAVVNGKKVGLVCRMR